MPGVRRAGNKESHIVNAKIVLRCPKWKPLVVSKDSCLLRSSCDAPDFTYSPDPSPPQLRSSQDCSQMQAFSSNIGLRPSQPLHLTSPRNVESEQLNRKLFCVKHLLEFQSYHIPLGAVIGTLNFWHCLIFRLERLKKVPRKKRPQEEIYMYMYIKMLLISKSSTE